MKQSLVAQFLNKLLNASLAGKNRLTIERSKFVREIADALRALGYIKSVTEQDNQLVIDLDEKMPISHLRMLSRPGLRQYSSARQIPRTRTRLGAVLVTTPKGVLTDYQAKKQKVGGELVCEVW